MLKANVKQTQKVEHNILYKDDILDCKLAKNKFNSPAIKNVTLLFNNNV